MISNEHSLFLSLPPTREQIDTAQQVISRFESDQDVTTLIAIAGQLEAFSNVLSAAEYPAEHVAITSLWQLAKSAANG